MREEPIGETYIRELLVSPDLPIYVYYIYILNYIYIYFISYRSHKGLAVSSKLHHFSIATPQSSRELLMKMTNRLAN